MQANLKRGWDATWPWLMAGLFSIIAGVWWVIENTGKAIYNWRGWIAFVAGICFVIWLIGIGLVAVGHSNYMSNVNKEIDPVRLKGDNDWARRNWAQSCNNNAAAGVLGGATMSADAIAACTAASFLQYPELDWDKEAEANRQKYVKKGDL